MDAKKLTTKQLSVAEIKPDQLFPNPHNPRILFDKAPLKILKDSIEQVGILVPLTVYKEKRTGRYIILDGQRRWIVAQELGLEKIPVNQVAEPTLVQNIVTMFQIHKLREDWELMPTALKLEVLMKELKERNEKKLSALTGLDQAVVVRCKKLLDFPRKYQDMMLDPDPVKRVKADFFIELYAVRNDRFVNSLDWYNRSDFTDAMLDRYTNKKGINSVTDFRIIKQNIVNSIQLKKESVINKRLREFFEFSDTPISHLEVAGGRINVNSKKLKIQILNLINILKDLDSESYYGEEQLWVELETLYRIIRKKLNDAQRRIKE